MRKTKLKSGCSVFGIKVEILVTKGRFALALTDHFYRTGYLQGNGKIVLTKRQAKEILIHELYWYGNQGEYQTGAFEGSFELGEQRNSIYSLCDQWVEKNYPYLIMPF